MWSQNDKLHTGPPAVPAPSTYTLLYDMFANLMERPTEARICSVVKSITRQVMRSVIVVDKLKGISRYEG